MDYSQYQESRDISWKLLIRHRVSVLPVRVSDICKKEGIALLSYECAEKMLDRLGLSDKCSRTDGFAVCIKGRFTVFYNKESPAARCRFTIAHELGHIFLNHLPADGRHVTAVNREPSPSDDPMEQAANVFASRLLAPACVLWGLAVKDAEHLTRVCDISMTSAKFRMERMGLLYEREKNFLKERGRSCFCLSPLERQVFEQFKAYIKENRL